MAAASLEALERDGAHHPNRPEAYGKRYTEPQVRPSTIACLVLVELRSGGPRGPPKMTRTRKKWYNKSRYTLKSSAQIIVDSPKGSQIEALDE